VPCKYITFLKILKTLLLFLIKNYFEKESASVGVIKRIMRFMGNLVL